MSAPSTQTPSLIWGVLSFIPPEDSGDVEDSDFEDPIETAFEIEAIDGTNRGNPVPIVETLPSLLIEGALAMVTGFENRSIPIRLRISANDGDALSMAEAALFQQVMLDQPPPLEWTSAVGNSATSIYDTVVAVLEEDTDEGWDLNEVLYGERYYTLTLTCLPFARAATSVVVPALPVPVDPDTPVWVDIDECDATTGWSMETTATGTTGPALNSGPPTLLVFDGLIRNVHQYLRAVRTGAISVPDDYYLAIDVDIINPGVEAGHWTAYYAGAWHSPVAIAPGIGEGPTGAPSTRLFFADVGDITELKIAFDVTELIWYVGPSPKTAASLTISVFNVAYTDTIGSSTNTTSRQQSRIATVLGSAPTHGAIRLYDATPDVLGTDLLVYTTRNTGFRPNLRQWIDPDAGIIAGADAALVSGSHHDLSTPTPFLVPADLLYSGTYALLANIDVSAAGTLEWEARIATAGGATTIVGGDVILSGTVHLEETDGYQIVDVGAMVLPPVELETSGRVVKLTLTGTADMEFDEGWLFSLDDGVLTWVRDGEEMTWLEVRSPELGAARPSVWGGRNAVNSGATCVDWKCLSFGPHRFDPGDIQVFTVCTTSLVSQCELEYFARYFGNVRGEEAA